jgi:hypothetical protein
VGGVSLQLSPFTSEQAKEVWGYEGEVHAYFAKRLFMGHLHVATNKVWNTVAVLGTRNDRPRASWPLVYFFVMHPTNSAEYVDAYGAHRRRRGMLCGGSVSSLKLCDGWAHDRMPRLGTRLRVHSHDCGRSPLTRTPVLKI